MLQKLGEWMYLGPKKTMFIFVRWFDGPMARPPKLCQVKFQLAPIGLKLGEEGQEIFQLALVGLTAAMHTFP